MQTTYACLLWASMLSSNGFWWWRHPTNWKPGQKTIKKETVLETALQVHSGLTLSLSW